jgi:scyllo-inositol 2-dehydrogenase (NADP+)
VSRIALLTALERSDAAEAVADLATHLQRCGIEVAPWPVAADAVMVWADRALGAHEAQALLDSATAGTPVLLAGPTAAAQLRPRDLGAGELIDAAGLIADAETPLHEIRLRGGRDAGALLARCDGDLIVRDTWLRVEKARDDVEVLLTAMAGLHEHPVMTWRQSANVGLFTVGSRAATTGDPAYQRLVHRWLRRVWGLRDDRPVRVGLLGYGAIGDEHSQAIAAVDGLELVAVCDRSPARVEAARLLAPELAGYDDADNLVAATDVDLVIVSTPPNTHADWALRALDAGKDVVVEKPFCLTTAEADELLAAAAASGRSLSVYQNRRWDADYLTLKRLVRSGAIGEVFHYESFVGGYGHPCNYWHSDEEVSGGAIYDWGSHYLDWVLDLLPGAIDHVSAATHKRLWHDVTNADHSRVQVRFADGAEAEFVHSDLAAAMKPKWYVLGTEGAIVGHWRSERVVGRDRMGNLVEDTLTAAESPAALTLHQPDGSVTTVAVAPAPRHPFHRELADHLVAGAPMSVTPEGSRRNIAVMEAATASAREGARPVRPL